MKTYPLKLRQLATFGLALGLASAAWADREHGLAAPMLKAYEQECAACHMAYPPGLLPAPSWQRLMNGLDKHFGVNASLDEATLKTLSSYLLAHAGRGGQASAPPQDRITQSSWFVRKHREFSAQDWANPRIKSAANCAACHTGAAQGDFDEDRVRIPSGVGGGSWWGRGHD